MLLSCKFILDTSWCHCVSKIEVGFLFLIAYFFFWSFFVLFIFYFQLEIIVHSYDLDSSTLNWNACISHIYYRWITAINKWKQTGRLYLGDFLSDNARQSHTSILSNALADFLTWEGILEKDELNEPKFI